MKTTATGRARRGVAALAAALTLAACADEPTAPLDSGKDLNEPAPAFAALLTCSVEVEAGSMDCDPSSNEAAGTADGPRMSLVVGSQHHFVRMANDAPVTEGDVWSANVTVQNLTLQPFGTADGTTSDADGVRVFLVDEPSNGVVIFNHDGAAAFTGSDPQKYYVYAGAALGEDGILSSGETSTAKSWQFTLNGATEFSFSVLIWTEVPDPTAYGVQLTSVGAGFEHSCGTGADGNFYCWGYNVLGQLGDGTQTDAYTPVKVVAPAGVYFLSVTAGNDHTCAEGTDRKVYCWGNNSSGQGGNGTESLVNTTPELHWLDPADPAAMHRVPLPGEAANPVAVPDA